MGRFKVAELAVYAYVTRLVKEEYEDEAADGWANEEEDPTIVYVNVKVSPENKDVQDC